MGEIVLKDLDLWEELDDRKSESAVGGAAERLGDNLGRGVPFTILINNSQGGSYQPNLTGWIQSANGQTYGAPAVVNVG